MKTSSGKRKSGPRAAAVIEFSSNNVRMVIGEGAEGRTRVLDFLEYPLALGKDTFTTGKVGFGKINTGCGIIRSYLETAAGYGVNARDVRVIATSALREAANKNYILDQIRLKTGMNVDIIDAQEEKLFIFKTALRLLAPEYLESALLVFVGSGNAGFSVVENGRVTFYRSVRIGPLRISELFEDVANRSREYHVLVEEYIRTFMNLSDGFPDVEIKRLILTGGDVNLIKDLCSSERRFVRDGRVAKGKAECRDTAKGEDEGVGEDGVSRISKQRFDALYDSVKDASTDSIAKEFGIPRYRADILIPAMCICGSFFEFAGTEEALAPTAYLNEAMLYRLLFPDAAARSDKAFYKNTIHCVYAIASRFGVSMRHAAIVEDFSIRIFDKIRKLHGMGAWERALLQCAAILHDCGKYISIRDHSVHSFNIVRGLDIIGLNQKDLKILGLICLIHSSEPPEKHNAFLYASDAEKAVTAKLAAILRLADSLDRSAMQKINEISVAFDGDELTIQASAVLNTDLEKWSFEAKSAFFGEVFGIKAVLRVKGLE